MSEQWFHPRLGVAALREHWEREPGVPEPGVTEPRSEWADRIASAVAAAFSTLVIVGALVLVDWLFFDGDPSRIRTGAVAGIVFALSYAHLRGSR